jgi:hypothetical protein
VSARAAQSQRALGITVQLLKCSGVSVAGRSFRGVQSVQEIFAATRPQNDHVLARLCYPLDYDAVSNYERPWVLTRMVRLGNATVLIVSNIRSQRPGLRSRLGYLEGHPYELSVHAIPF